MNNDNFYNTIKPFNSFKGILEPANYHQVPDDWFVVVADIKGSTIAINEGRYKDVNIIGASSIIAVINALKSYDKVPFVFGGDGATFVIPPALVQPVIQALHGTQEMAKDSFNLELRVGIVPVHHIHKTKTIINIARYQMSEHLHIAMFSGGGLNVADDMIKACPEEYDIQSTIDKNLSIESDFNGLECRWNPIKSTNGQMLTLIIQGTDGEKSQDIYKKTLAKIEAIYGQNDNYRPNHMENMNLSFNGREMTQELNVRTHKLKQVDRLKYAINMRIEAILGTLLFKYDLHAKGVEGIKYKQDAIANTDFQKFDDALRMVIDSTPEQTASLIAFLEHHRQNGDCYYGAHIADEAIITCLIFQRVGKHLHFIDGGNGGYTLASQKLKEMRATQH